MNVITDDLLEIYKKIEKAQKRYGDLKKCEIHLHTPASYDYRLVPDKSFKQLTEKEVINIAKDYGYFTEIQQQKMLSLVNEGEYKGQEYLDALSHQKVPYDSLKEYIAYMLIAHQLYSHKIEVVVISDHNTISGYYKLQYALNKYFIERLKGKVLNQKSIHLFLGVEISCADKNHVVGIFDEANYKNVMNFLERFVITEKDGTCDHSLTIIRAIADIGGLPYIAHINSSDYIGTNIYKKSLFSSDILKVLGLTNISVKGKVLNSVRNYVKEKEFCFLHESDAHDLDSIGINNTWIKFNSFTFGALRQAISNYSFCVFTTKPNFTDKYIKGICIDPGDDGYLCGAQGKQDKFDKNMFNLDFSRDLNCIIGGRGTGKSTLLNIIETVFTMETTNRDQLEFLSQHKRIYIVFSLKGKEYIIRFLPQRDSGKSYTGKHVFHKNAFIGDMLQDDKIKLANHWMELFEIEKKREDTFVVSLVTIQNRREILKKVYRKGYSINNIIHRIDQGEIGDFVRETVFNGIKLEFKEFLNQLKKENKNKYKKYFRENLNNLIRSLDSQKAQVRTVIDGFNKENKDLIKIELSPKQGRLDYFLGDLLLRINQNKHIAKTFLTWGEVERYLYEIVDRIGFLEFFNLLVTDKYKELEKIVSILNFTKNASSSITDVDKGFETITERNLPTVYREIKNELLKDKDLLLSALNKYFAIIDDYTLFFNINSKESIHAEKVFMKNIEYLSLGQKVVAILTFILNYGTYCGDNSPLIIDQPEDNLDNQYIYKNLVSSLRQVKNERQVIVVTHSSTIVTNADAEQVIVLKSDNKHGWIENRGYPSDKIVMKYIVQYLEGGEESFKHKMDAYSTILLGV